MDVLIRERRESGKTAEYRDREITTGVISIGGAPDQSVQLLGDTIAGRQLTITAKAGSVTLRSLKGKVVVNGRAARSTKLEVGDRIELGGHSLDIIQPPAGFDLAIEIERDESLQASLLESAYSTRLADSLGSKRTWSWAMLVMILAGGLAVPLYLIQSGEDGTGAVWLPDDRLWSTGSLLSAHELVVGDDCSTCHTTLFQRVRDEQCTDCHNDINDHVDESSTAVVDSARCASCHREHNDPALFVIRRDTLCIDCHGEREGFPPDSGIEAVTGFSANTHPPFDAQLLVSESSPVGNLLSFEWVSRLESDQNEERSNLKFPHDVHLDGTKVQRLTDDEALGCADCHELSSDREHFLAIEMETHCRTCHDLRFDLSSPTRELPHGESAEVIFALEGHYLRRFSDPNASTARTRPRRIPDRDPEEEECTADAFDCATEATLTAAVNQFTRRGCVTCHVVGDNQSEQILERFQVHPVRLQTDYFPAGQFPHDKHLTQDEAAGDAACTTCHSAIEATSSNEVLIPDLETCSNCHGDSASRDAVVALTCGSCHVYHPLEHFGTGANVRQ